MLRTGKSLPTLKFQAKTRQTISGKGFLSKTGFLAASWQSDFQYWHSLANWLAIVNSSSRKVFSYVFLPNLHAWGKLIPHCFLAGCSSILVGSFLFGWPIPSNRMAFCIYCVLFHDSPKLCRQYFLVTGVEPPVAKNLGAIQAPFSCYITM